MIVGALIGLVLGFRAGLKKDAQEEGESKIKSPEDNGYETPHGNTPFAKQEEPTHKSLLRAKGYDALYGGILSAIAGGGNFIGWLLIVATIFSAAKTFGSKPSKQQKTFAIIGVFIALTVLVSGLFLGFHGLFSYFLYYVLRIK